MSCRARILSNSRFQGRVAQTVSNTTFGQQTNEGYTQWDNPPLELGTWRRREYVAVLYVPVYLVLTSINTMMFVANATRLDSRRVDEAMRGHRRRGATQKTGMSRRKPPGGKGLRAISSSLLVDDAAASPPPRFSTSPPKPPPQTSPYLCSSVLSFRAGAWRCQQFAVEPVEFFLRVEVEADLAGLAAAMNLDAGLPAFLEFLFRRPDVGVLVR